MDPLGTPTHFIERNLSLLFRLGMWWRIMYGVLRIALGVAFIKLIGRDISELIYVVMSHELTGPTGDAVLEKLYLLLETHELTVTYFIAGYFIFWGVADVVLSACLLRHIIAAFPITMGLIVLFITYSIYRLSYTHSLILLSVIVVDFFILYLVYREYRVLRAFSGGTSTPSGPPHRQF